MARKIIFLLYSSLAIFCVGLLLYNNFFNEEAAILLENKHAFTFFVALLVGLFRMYNGNTKKKSLSYYKKNYKEFIRDSFSNDKKSLKKLLKAIKLLNEDKFDKSIQLLESLLPDCKTLNEKYVTKLFLALNHEETGDTDKTCLIYEELIQYGLADSIIYSNVANSYRKNGQTEKAIEACKKALLIDSKNTFAYNSLAGIYFIMGEFDKAIENAKKALEYDPKILPSIKYLIIIYTLLEDEEECENYKKKALANGMTKKELEEMLASYC